MAVQRDRPYLNGNFTVDLGAGAADSVAGGFAEVVLPAAAIDAIEYRIGNEKSNEARKLSGPIHYDNLVLRRGVIGSLDLYEWWNEVRNGSATALRTVIVTLLSEDHAQPVLTWKFVGARPAKYTGPVLNAGGNDIAIEEIELAFERMEME
jgi:phage tail-like protein